MFLAGDIGGTKTHLALVREDKTRIREEKFPSKDWKTLEEIVDTFLGGERVERACFGIAGPVKNNEVKTTNLPWKIAASSFSIPEVKLLNDLEANAYGLFELNDSQLHVVNKGIEQKGNQTLVSAGTGLGEAGLYFDGKALHPFACEGGHSSFAPQNEEQVELFLHLHKRFGHVSFERIVCGPGIYNVYEFLSSSGRWEPDAEVESVEERERPRVITEKRKTSEICKKTIEMFVEIYGAEAGNCALKFMSYGGVFVGGGIAPRIIDLIGGEAFMEAFSSKGRFESILGNMPVKVVLEQEAALLGSIHYVTTRM